MEGKVVCVSLCMCVGVLFTQVTCNPRVPATYSSALLSCAFQDFREGPDFIWRVGGLVLLTWPRPHGLLLYGLSIAEHSPP